jgi:hypothetical protein
MTKFDLENGGTIFPRNLVINLQEDHVLVTTQKTKQSDI